MNFEKRVLNKFGKHYFLGQDEHGTNYWLEEASWDCDWYWGGLYIHTFTNNKCPPLSRDISVHTHFDSLFFNKKENGHTEFIKLFHDKTPFTDSEKWKIMELAKAFYIAKQYAEVLYLGGAHYTENPVKDVIKSEEEYNRINKVVIPAILKELYKILSPEED